MRYVGNLQVSTPSDTEIVVSRVFDQIVEPPVRIVATEQLAVAVAK